MRDWWKTSVHHRSTTLRSRSSPLDRDRSDPELADARRVSELSVHRRIVLDPEALTRVEARGDAMRSVVVYTSGWASVPLRLGGAHNFFSCPPHSLMQKIPATVQRLILAFTTGLFLACAAHVSAQGDTIPLSGIQQ
jgi:hypothetical protein